ncbi:hypothetical protein B0T11DRAFT_140796 [Plectosphaerella cucumerina]|uniref:Uncharacterized protein n=1 Tax=Plectosphaerella cucumerina TaxID=40658 RepID=A0A8K0WY45_9PEZI|nr:hypothetical protein B0T11DRAFT_140796 [Plectosphaerella cucumerina]
MSDLPPSYSDATSSSPCGPPSYTSHLSAYLASLPATIRTNHDSHLAHQAAFDADLLALLTPDIDSLLLLLSSPAPSHRAPPQTASLVLVPAAAVPSGARYVHDDAPGHVVRVARISDPTGSVPSFKKSGNSEKRASSAWDAWGSQGESSSSSATREFSDWGRWEDDGDAEAAANAGSLWWWRDEDLARRLAGHLQPGPQIRVDRASVRQAVETSRGQGFRDRLRTDSSRAPPGESPAMMTVVAEEVTFRRENEMGIWERLNGWGIIARIDLRGTR